MKNVLYTTVTLSDFKDKTYIDQLLALNVGIELALLTSTLEDLKQEVDGFKHTL